MRLSVDQLRDLVHAAVLRYGYTPSEADRITEVLLYAQLRGNNQGVVKLIGPGIPKSPAAEEPRIEREAGASVLIDARETHAMIAVNYAVEVAINRAASSGLAVVAIRGLNTSSGAIGFYARRMAEAGYVGVVLAGTRAMVAPTGSYEAVLGTNPIAIAVPTTTDPIVLDMSTAAMPFYGILEAQAAGRPLPDGVAYSENGQQTTDPTEATQGALRPFGDSARAYGLAFMIEVLTGPLCGAAFAGIGDTQRNWAGHLLLAIRPSGLVDEGQFREGVAQLSNRVRNAKKLTDVDHIMTPGERGDKATRQAMRVGSVEIEDNLFRELSKVAGVPH